jgi:hypothetical protein
MKNTKHMRTTVAVAILTSLISSCSIKNTKKIENFECKNRPYTHTLNLQYDKEEGKVKLISFEDTKGENEKILGETFDAFEKEEIVIWKVQRDDGYKADAFFNLKQMKLEIKDGGGEQKALEQTLDCKKKTFPSHLPLLPARRNSYMTL